MCVEFLGLGSTLEELSRLGADAPFLIFFFFKVGHFQPLHNNRWEQVYESNVFDLKSLSLKVNSKVEQHAVFLL